MNRRKLMQMVRVIGFLALSPAVCAAQDRQEPEARPSKEREKLPAFKIEAPLNRGGALLTVHVVEQKAASNWHYELHLTTTDGLDQRFKVRNGQPITRQDVRLVDLTADGYLDLMIVGGKDHRGEDWFKTWLYDPRTKTYRWINDRR